MCFDYSIPSVSPVCRRSTSTAWHHGEDRTYCGCLGKKKGFALRRFLERAMGFEPTTTCLGSKDSTTELRPPREEFQHIT